MASFALSAIFVLLAGCSEQSSEFECMQRALEQPGLKRGRVAFGEIGRESLFAQRGRWPGPKMDAVVPVASLTKSLIAEQVRLRVASLEINLSCPISELLLHVRFN
ncbi:hypothetical protein [Stenotrophomonas sp. CC120223-11]|uniref:hypothetical protein n=1 Tax=Stenotrophomonas sp. CC120223-11 TaxID=1378090 RepID=UPI001143CC0E|nr:hypothetical protein [Stenotrophomonas sp. CC120223-11]